MPGAPTCARHAPKARGAVRVLVTGATGYLGRAIVRALRERGHTTVAFARRASSTDIGGECLDGDVTDAHAVDRAVATCDAVCHAAALVAIWRPDPAVFDRVNIEGTRHVFDAVQRHGACRCVYTSSFLALPPRGHVAALALNDYQRTKALALGVADDFVARGVPIVSLFPGVIYGPGAPTEGNLVGRLLIDRVEGRLPGSVGLERIWSFAYIDDVARAHAVAVDAVHVQHRYGLGGENLPQRALFDWLERTQRLGTPWSLPASVARVAGWLEEQRARISGATPRLTRGAVDVFVHDWPLDSSDAIRDLAYRITPLDDGLAATWSSLTAAGHVA